MWKFLAAAAALAVPAFAQNLPPQVELANLREDVRGLTQRLGELSLRVDQLERENAELKRQAGAAGRGYATVAQVDAAIADLNRAIKTAVANSENETLQQVSAQMKKLATATNTALESLAKSAPGPRVAAPAGPSASTPAAPAPASAAFSENYAKEGVSYTVQKGDNLATIAKKTGGKQQDIINANKLSDPSRIVVGQTLFIPGGK